VISGCPEKIHPEKSMGVQEICGGDCA